MRKVRLDFYLTTFDICGFFFLQFHSFPYLVVELVIVVVLNFLHFCLILQSHSLVKRIWRYHPFPARRDNNEIAKILWERTLWNSNINSPLIPWSVNPYLLYKYSIFGKVHLKWYISHSFKGYSRFMLWGLTKNQSSLRPYYSDFLLTTTCFIPSWMMMNEMGVSSHKEKYSGHLKPFCLYITWQLAVVIFGVRRVRFKILM